MPCTAYYHILMHYHVKLFMKKFYYSSLRFQKTYPYARSFFKINICIGVRTNYEILIMDSKYHKSLRTKTLIALRPFTSKSTKKFDATKTKVEYSSRFVPFPKNLNILYYIYLQYWIQYKNYTSIPKSKPKTNLYYTIVHYITNLTMC